MIFILWRHTIRAPKGRSCVTGRKSLIFFHPTPLSHENHVNTESAPMERGVFVQSRPAGTASLGKHTLASPQDTIVGMVIMRRDREAL
jgi:hypothetical protein